MEYSDSVKRLLGIAREAHTSGSPVTWPKFWAAVELAFEKCELTEAEYRFLKNKFFEWDDNSDEGIRFIRAYRDGGECCEGFTKAQQLISQVTGESFVLLAGFGVDINLYHDNELLGSVIRATESQNAEIEVVLCGRDTLRFCQKYKISTLHAKDVWALFLGSLESISKRAGFKRITLCGTELFVDRHIELLGYTRVCYNKDKTETWEKLLY